VITPEILVVLNPSVCLPVVSRDQEFRPITMDFRESKTYLSDTFQKLNMLHNVLGDLSMT